MLTSLFWNILLLFNFPIFSIFQGKSCFNGQFKVYELCKTMLYEICFENLKNELKLYSLLIYLFEQKYFIYIHLEARLFLFTWNVFTINQENAKCRLLHFRFWNILTLLFLIFSVFQDKSRCWGKFKMCKWWKWSDIVRNYLIFLSDSYLRMLYILFFKL